MNERGVEWRSRIRLVDEVAAVLRESIYAGRIQPGARLRQEQLAAELDVSRTPLREALRMLEREGLVSVDRTRGVRVISADRETLLAAYALREVVDGLAARLAARAASGLSTSLLAVVERQRRSLAPWNAARYTAANVEFHSAIIQATHNEFVAAQLPLVHMTSRVFVPTAQLDSSRAELAISEHLSIAEAIAEGLPEDAEERARAHIRRTVSSLLEHDARESAGEPVAS
jgi:DNA-binding GntR family transcriptional regulator